MPTYALIELTGHDRMAVMIEPSTIPALLQVVALMKDGSDGPRQHLGPNAVYRLHTVTEEVARLTAKHATAVLYRGAPPSWMVAKNPEVPCAICKVPMPKERFRVIGPFVGHRGALVLDDGEVACRGCAWDAHVRTLPKGAEHASGCKCRDCEIPF